MDKKIKRTFITTIIILAVLNVFWVVVFWINQHKIQTFYKGLNIETVDVLTLDNEQKKCVRSICKDLVSRHDSILHSIAAVSQLLLDEVAKEEVDLKKIDSLEIELMDSYRKLLHETVMEYKNIAKDMCEDQKKQLDKVYIDLFMRIYSPFTFTHIDSEKIIDTITNAENQ